MFHQAQDCNYVNVSAGLLYEEKIVDQKPSDLYILGKIRINPIGKARTIRQLLFPKKLVLRIATGLADARELSHWYI